jgi:hypothetical protein
MALFEGIPMFLKYLAESAQINSSYLPLLLSVHLPFYHEPVDFIEEKCKFLYDFQVRSSAVRRNWHPIDDGLNVGRQLGRDLRREAQFRFAHLHQVIEGGLNLSVRNGAAVSVDPLNGIFNILQQVFMSFLTADDGFHLALEIRKLRGFLAVAKILPGFSEEETIRRAVYFLLSLRSAARGADE